MATSLVSTGLKFPDDTIQTTAAGAGGSSLEAIASGSLSDGSKVIVNTDGTVSVVVGVAQAVGTPVVFRSEAVGDFSSTYDSNAQKVVIAYRDQGNSNYGTTVVGTVSGTSIAFGTPVVFESSYSDFISATFDSTNNKVIIAYRDIGNSNYGTAIVGTVSGTSISFGTAVVFESANTEYSSAIYDLTQQKIVIAYRDRGNDNSATVIVGTVSGTAISFGTPAVIVLFTTYISATYDLTAQKVVIAYQDGANSSYGTAVVGTVSGTSISFGTAVVFESANTQAISATFDSANSKVVIAYLDNGNSNFGTAVVGTVSGTSISFGSPVVFESASSILFSPTYDSNAQKVVIAYQDKGNSDYGTAVVGTVSGTSISFDTPIVFNSTVTSAITTTYDLSAQKVIIGYSPSSGFGNAVVFQNESTNLTAENYIGISNAAYTDTQTATIQVAGAVDDAQTGLTAGQAYYVQPDGTLSTTPGTPEVFAGTAVSSTKLIVKG